MNAPRPVAVVIPSWNSAGLLPDCLGALAEQGVELETVVVDNGSSDGSLDYLRRQGVRHVALPRNTGFAVAVNRGVAETSAPTVLLLNADAMLEPGAMARMLEALEADSDLGGVQPRILQLEQGGQRDIGSARLYSAGQALTADGRGFELGAGEAQRDLYLQPREVFGVCGAACLLRRQLLDELGGYDERYFSFYEDVDLNVRGRIAGWRFAYAPEAVAWHLGNASWMAEAPRPSAWNARLVARNRIATQAKFMPLRSLPRILLVEAGSLARAAAQRRLRATLRGKLEGLDLLPEMLQDRHRLAKEGDLKRPRKWLGKRP